MATKIRTKDLEGGALTPGLSKYFGTDASGNKGFFTLPSSASQFNTRDNFVYGEDMSPATPVFFGKGITNTKAFYSYQTGTNFAFGNGVNIKLQFGIYISKQTILRNIQLYMAKTAAPTDNLNLYIYASDRTTLVATSTTTLAGTAITTTGFQTFTFADVVLTDDTYYYVEIRRDGAQSGTNYYQFYAYPQDGYQAFGSVYAYSGTVRAILTEYSPYMIIQYGTDYTADRLYKVDSRFSGTSIMNGITEDSKLAGNAGGMTLMGTNNLFTNLLKYRQYHINNDIVGQTQSRYNTTMIFGYATTDREKQAQSFQLGRRISIDRVFLAMYRTNTPTDNVIVTIETDNGSNAPSGTLVNANATITIPYYDITSNQYMENIPYAFTGYFDLEADVKYWIVVKRSGATNTSHYYNIRINTTTPYYYYGQSRPYANAARGAVSDTDKIRFMFMPEFNFRRQSNYSGTSNVGYYRYDSHAQCFAFSDDVSFTKMLIRAWKAGAPTDDLVVRIETNFKDQLGCETNGYQETGGVSGYAPFGTNAAQKMAHKFIGTQTVDVRYLYLQRNKTGSLADNVTVRIETDNAGAPSGNLVATGATCTIANAQIPAGSVWAAKFVEGFTLTAATTYWIVFQRTGALDDANYYSIGFYGASGTAAKGFYLYNGSTWSSYGPNYVLYYRFNNCVTTNNQNRPSGKLVSANHKITIPAASLTAVGYAIEKIDFPASVSFSKNTLYRLVFERSGVETSAAYYGIAYGSNTYNGLDFNNQVFHHKYLDSSNTRYGKDSECDFRIRFDFLGDFVPTTGQFNLYRGTYGGASVQALTATMMQLGVLYKGMNSSEYVGSVTGTVAGAYSPERRPSVNGLLRVSNSTAGGSQSIQYNPYVSKYSSGWTTYGNSQHSGTSGVLNDCIPVFSDTRYRIAATNGQVTTYRFIPLG